MPTLLELLSQDKTNIHIIAKYFNNLAAEAIVEVNKEFGPKRLSKLPRQAEPLPTDTRQLSSYRTRIGTMLEYAISTAMAKLLEIRYGEQYLLTFATAHEYPDFYLRNSSLNRLFRIEMKAVDADSDEQSARFSTPTAWIKSEQDMLLLVGWKWADIVNQNQVIGEYPHIFASVVLPAGEIAEERDTRLTRTRGKIEGGKVYVYSKKKGDFVLDPGNYGKFWRIVHSTRHSDDLSEVMREFIKFLREIDQHSPRKRFQRRDKR